VFFVALQPDTDLSVRAPVGFRLLEMGVEHAIEICGYPLVHQRGWGHHHGHTIDQLPLLLLRALIPEGMELPHRQLRRASEKIARHCFDLCHCPQPAGFSLADERALAQKSMRAEVADSSPVAATFEACRPEPKG